MFQVPGSGSKAGCPRAPNLWTLDPGPESGGVARRVTAPKTFFDIFSDSPLRPSGFFDTLCPRSPPHGTRRKAADRGATRSLRTDGAEKNADRKEAPLGAVGRDAEHEERNWFV